jgi:thioesterase domain-containing protein/acyl carrier protein
LAYIVPNIQNVPSIRAIREGLSKHLPEYMLPARYIFLNQLPTNPTGKVDRLALPMPGKERPALQVPYAAPQNDLENELVAIWSEVLGIEEIGVNDDFGLLGGDSLSATQIFFMIEERLNTKLPPSILMEAPTIKQIADQLSEFQERPENTLVVLRRAVAGQPTLILFTPLMGDVIIFRDMLQYLPDEIGVLGIQSWTEDREILFSKTVDELLDDYLPLLLTEQTKGPYYLGGFSFGGALAYQAADRLQRLGNEVGFVFLLDTIGPGKLYKNELYHSLGEHWQMFMQTETMKAKVDYIYLAGRGFFVFLKDKLRKFEKQMPGKNEQNIPVSILKRPYSAPELDVDVYLFTATAKKWRQHTGGDKLGWDSVVKGQLVHNYLSGDHVTHFTGENAKTIVDILLATIRQRE